MSNVPNYKIAITGTIGSGKSTVTKYLSRKYPTISSDKIVANMYEDKEFVKEVNKLLFDINSDILDKVLLAETIFNDAEQKSKLEALIHPKVKERIIEFMEEREGLVFVEVPLLFEAKFEYLFDKIITVVASEETVIKRLMKYRHYSYAESLDRIKNQFSIDYKIKNSDYVVKNNGSIKQMKYNVDKLIKKIESD